VYELGGLAVPDIEGRPRIRHLSCSADNFGPTVFLDGDYNTFFNGDEVVSGVTSMRIPTNLISASLSVDLDDRLATEAIAVSNTHGEIGARRRTALRQRNTYLEKKEPVWKRKNRGSYSVLVVRVSDIHGNSPTNSAKAISNSIFNGYMSLATGFHTCSNNQLFFYKADGGSDVRNGVVDVVVPQDLSKAYDSSVCVNAADSVLSSSSYDVGNTHSYTMYICPDVVQFGSAAGVAQMGGNKSWFKDKWASIPFVQMHEMGHNLRLFHSSEGEFEYGDPTGFMGNAYEHRQGWGRMCLNAAKTYQSGWYSRYNTDVDPMHSPYLGSLVDVNSVYRGNVKEHDNVVVRIGNTQDGEALYVMLHRLEGITSDMVEEFIPTHANRVNIVSQSHNEGVPSTAVKQLASGEQFIQKDWAGTGKTLHIKVCSIAKKSEDGGAKVIVYLGRRNFVSCEMMRDTESPSPSPSATPSLVLSSQPTMKPSTQPSAERERCVNSSLKMIFPNGTLRGCAWVMQSKRRDRCLIPGVASHCPVICGTCIECLDSGIKFQMPFKDIKTCAWVKKNNTRGRCAMRGVAETCRATCGTCSS